MPGANSMQITLRRTWLGKTCVIIRTTKPAGWPGGWAWGRWRRPTQTEHAMIAARLWETST